MKEEKPIPMKPPISAFNSVKFDNPLPTAAEEAKIEVASCNNQLVQNSGNSKQHLMTVVQELTENYSPDLILSALANLTKNKPV